MTVALAYTKVNGVWFSIFLTIIHVFTLNGYSKPNQVVTTIMDKSLGTNFHFWRFCVHARRVYNFTCLTSPPTPHTMLKTTTCNFN